MLNKTLGTLAAAATVFTLASVNPAEAATLGGKIYAKGGDVIVSFLPSDAGFTSELRLFKPDLDLANSIFIGTNKDPLPKTVNLGSFAAGTELIFGIFVINTGNTFFIGDADRNPDNIFHAIVDTIPGGAKVGFEDLLDGGDKDFNDVEFEFKGVTTEVEVPEPASALGLLALGVVGAGSVLKRKQSRSAEKA